MDRNQPHLIKFCKKEHNVHNGSTLRIGTLYDYRHIENQELRDVDEGKYTFVIEFPEEITLDRRWSNLLLQGAVGFGGPDDTPRFPGSFRANIEKLHIVRGSGDEVVVRDTRVHIEREVPDSFIFCMSLKNAPDKPFDGYDDHWTVPSHQTNSFANTLGSLIFDQVPLSSFTESMAQFITPRTASTLNLNVRHRAVIYEDRHITITERNRPTYDTLIELLSNVAFIKPAKFAPEQEYRFMFELTQGRRIFQPAVKGFMVQPNPFKNLTD